MDNAHARALIAAGVRLAIWQFVSPNQRAIWRTQITNCTANGLRSDAYVYLWFSDGPQLVRERVAWAIAEAQTAGVHRLWLDCEQGPRDDDGYDYQAPGSPDRCLPIIRDAVRQVQAAGLVAGIYTARWWWVPATGDTSEFAYLPLWVAQYDAAPDLDVFTPFGGWSRPAIKQYASDATLAGCPMLDLNWFEEDDVTTMLPLTDQQKVALGLALGTVFGIGPNGQPTGPGHFNDLVTAAHGYGLGLAADPPPGSKRIVLDVPESLIP